MPGPVLRFVDSLASSPGVRLDLNSWNPWIMDPATDFGVPALRRSISSTMLRDGDYVGEDAYGNRELSLVLSLRTTNADTAATQLQALQRELDRPTNVLQYTPNGATNTVFFRTFRSPLERIRWKPDVKPIQVSILAEPFALGLRQDIGSVAVSNDPAVANGLFLDLTGIKGDVETPLLLETTRGASYFQRGLAVGVRPKGAASTYPAIFRQAESLTMGTNTTATADVLFSGGNKARCTFATATMQTRVSGVFPTATVPAGLENIGQYRVFARVARSAGSDPINMRTELVLDNGTKLADGITISLPASGTTPALVDLGVISIGDSFPQYFGFDTIAFRAENLPTLRIQAERLGGATSSLDIDYIALVPADYRFGAWGDVSTTADAAARAIVDSGNEIVYGAKATTSGTPGVWTETSPVPLTGVFPYVRPGDNRVVIVEPGFSNDLATVTTVVCRYWPRYLLARPVST